MKANILLLFIIIFGLGCSEKDELPTPSPGESTISFNTTSKNLSEADGALEVKIYFDKPAPNFGSLKVRLAGDAVYSEHYMTNPVPEEDLITIKIEKGANEVSFNLFPVNDEAESGNKVVSLSIEYPPSGFKLGDKSALIVTLLDDDDMGGGNGNQKGVIQFKEQEGSIKENGSNGIEIELEMTGGVLHTELLSVIIFSPLGTSFGTDYRTVPSAIDNYFTIDVYPQIESITFTFYPINNNVRGEDLEYVFIIDNTSDGLQKGERTTYTLTVHEDDIINPVEINTIADLRDKFEEYEGDWYFPEDYYIEGIITSDKNVINNKTVYIQDETGGIMLVFAMENLLKKGDRVQLNLKNAGGNYVNQQKAITGVIDRLGIITGAGLSVAPELITLEQLASGNYEGKRVRLQGVSFYSVTEENTWSGTYSIKQSDGLFYGSVTTYPEADFSHAVLPRGSFTLTGIVGSWNNIHPQAYYEDVIR